MKILSLAVALFGILALVLSTTSGDGWEAGLGVCALISALATFRSAAISSFLKIFVAIFATETIVFGLVVSAGKVGLWPKAYAEYLPPEPLPITVAVFSILTYLVSLTPVVRQITRIADRYFNATELGQARVWPLPAYTSFEWRIAAAMVVFLVLINQAEVGMTVRLSFFNRDLFNAIQNRDAAAFWQQLLLVFTPVAFALVFSQVVEFVVKSMLVIRWRHWLTEYYISHWLSDHAHYRMTLVGSEADNPDQRIAEDVNRFIDGGNQSGATQGYYGIYSLLGPDDLDALLVGLICGRVVGTLDRLYIPGHGRARAGLFALGRPDLRSHRNGDRPLDRAFVGRALFRAPARGGELPVLAGTAARI